MTKLLVLILLIMGIGVVMTMTGRGGGNFYVLILALGGISMHEAAATGQLILVATATTAFLLFQKKRIIAWKMVFLIGPIVAAMAFIGGYCSKIITGRMLKFTFSGLLVVAAFLMLTKIYERQGVLKRKPGYWLLRSGQSEYLVNLWLALPVTIATGFAAGMVGVSGGSFLVPLMVLACGMPMQTAVGTSTAMVATTAAMGFAGHAINGDFNPHWALPLVAAAVIGGLIGGRLALKTKPSFLKKLFAYTTLAAAIFMALNAYFSN